jgi:hypothetical protein
MLRHEFLRSYSVLEKNAKLSTSLESKHLISLTVFPLFKNNMEIKPGYSQGSQTGKEERVMCCN